MRDDRRVMEEERDPVDYDQWQADCLMSEMLARGQTDWIEQFCHAWLAAVQRVKDKKSGAYPDSQRV